VGLPRRAACVSRASAYGGTPDLLTGRVIPLGSYGFLVPPAGTARRALARLHGRSSQSAAGRALPAVLVSSAGSRPPRCRRRPGVGDRSAAAAVNLALAMHLQAVYYSGAPPVRDPAAAYSLVPRRGGFTTTPTSDYCTN
jgi:hypothetical protein